MTWGYCMGGAAGGGGAHPFIRLLALLHHLHRTWQRQGGRHRDGVLDDGWEGGGMALCVCRCLRV